MRYDTGMPLGYLQAVVRIACQRDDVGPAFREWLGRFVAESAGLAGADSRSAGERTG
jgi:UTP--glucose-1-phosphate uridylyltransferase